MNIEIPGSLVKRMQKCAVPLVDTPVSVLEKWADFYEQHHSSSSKGASPTVIDSAPAKQKLNPTAPPDLLHTRVRGSFGKTPFSNWNDLVRTAHIEGFKKLGSYDLLRRISHAQIKNGEFSKDGYKFVPEVGISVQGVDANRAWEHSLRLAMHLKVPLEAEVEWRYNEKAAYPGECGVLIWTP